MPESGLCPGTLVRVQPGPWKRVLMKRISSDSAEALTALLLARSDGFLG